MLIVSDFHDYYDVGMKLGVDKSIFYNRKKIKIAKDFLAPTHTHAPTGWNKSVLGFCGKFYPFVYHCSYGKVDRIVWTLEEALDALPRSKYGSIWGDDCAIDSEKGIRNFFGKDFSEFYLLFHEYKTPLIGLKPNRTRRYAWDSKEPYTALTVNPSLKEIEFYKVKDPITAFQDIYMFISGVIGVDNKPMIEISDKHKAAAKGHDGEYSFKKPPGKRGKKRWR